MKLLPIFFLVLIPFEGVGQNGYLKLIGSDSIMTGYLKYYISDKDGHQGIELWRNKKDKNPQRVPKNEISGYAIRKDTFKILQNFKPFYDSNIYFTIVDAKLKSGGKVNLYVIENYTSNTRVSTYTGGGIIPAIIDESMGNFTYLYILEDATGYMRALPTRKKKLIETLKDVFPEKYIDRYGELKREITYKAVPDLVKLYNSK